MKTLESVGPKLEGREEDVSFVKNIIASCEFETLFKVPIAVCRLFGYV